MHDTIDCGIWLPEAHETALKNTKRFLLDEMGSNTLVHFTSHSAVLNFDS